MKINRGLQLPALSHDGAPQPLDYCIMDIGNEGYEPLPRSQEFITYLL